MPSSGCSAMQGVNPPPQKKSNYAHDNNLCSKGKDRDIIKNLFRKDFWALTVFFFFFENYMVLNQNKCNYMCIGKNTENAKFEFDNLLLKNSK